MSLTKHSAVFRDQLKTLYNDRTLSEDTFAEALVDCIDEHLRSAVMILNSGQTAQGVGSSPTAGSVAVTVTLPPLTGSLT